MTYVTRSLSLFLTAMLVTLVSGRGLAQCSPDNVAPSITAPLIYTLTLDGSGQGSVSLTDLGVQATDNCGVPTLRLLNASFTCADIGLGASNVVTIVAEDAAGNTSQQPVAVVVLDGTAPAFTGPTALTVNCVADIPSSSNPPALFDACDPSPVAILFSETTSGTVTTRRYTVSDAAGNSQMQTVTITVSDATGPVFSRFPASFPATQIVECPVTPSSRLGSVVVTARDACAPNAVAVGTPVRTSTQGGDPTQADFYEYTVTDTYTATDANGNSSTLVLSASVEDNAPPVFSVTPPAGPISTSSTNPSGPCFASFSGDYSGNVSDACVGTIDYLTSSITILDDQASVVYTKTGSGALGLQVSENLGVGVYTVSLSSTDPSGNTGTTSFNLTIQDNEAPVARCIQTTVVSLDNSGQGIITAAQVDNGSSDNCSAVTLSLSRTTFSCSDIGLNTVVMTVTDAGGRTNSCSVVVDVQDNSAPAVICRDIARSITTASPTVTIVPTDIAAGPIASFDACGGTIGLTALVSRSARGPFTSSVDLDCSDVGNARVYLQVTDANGNDAVCVSTVTLTDNERPDANCVAITRTFQANGSYRLNSTDIQAITSTSTDNCGIRSTRLSREFFTCADLDQRALAAGQDTVHVRVVVTDLSGNTDQCTAVVTLVEDTDPMLSCMDRTLSVDGAGDLTVTPDQFLSGSLYLEAENRDGIVSSTFTVTQAYDLSFDYDVLGRNSDFQFGYTINGARQGPGGSGSNRWVVRGNGTASGSFIIPSLNIGDVVAFYVDDDVSGSVTGNGGWARVSNLVATPVNGTAAEAFNLPASAYTFAGAGFAHYVDACGPVVYEIREAGTTDPFAASLSLNCSNVSPTVGVAVEIRATDRAGNEATCTSQLTVVDNAAPSVTCLDQTVALNTSGLATVSAASFDNGSSTDACDGTNLSFYFVDASLQSLGATLDFDCTDLGTETLIIAAEDQSGNVGYCNPSLTIVDNRGPTITNYPNQAIDCSADVSPANTGMATAVDNCGGAVTLTFSDTDLPGSISQSCRTIQRRWLAEDARGNTSVAFQLISVSDNQAPAFVTNRFRPGYIAPSITAECDTTTAVVPVLTDNCDMDVSVLYRATDSRRNSSGVLTVTPADPGYYQYSIFRLWTATDDCGNSSVRSQTVSVDDRRPPVFDVANAPDNLVYTMDIGQCSQTVSFDFTGLISDACAPTTNLTVTNNAPGGDGVYVAGGVYPAGPQSITYTATDVRGNSSTFTVNFDVRDGQSPQMVLPSLNPVVVLSSGGPASVSPTTFVSSVSDNCSVPTLSLSQATFTCADVAASPVAVTITAMDQAGNSNSQVLMVTVVDAADPVFDQASLPMASITVNCDDSIDPSVTGQPTFSTLCQTAENAVPADVVISGAGNCRTIERTFTATNASTGRTATWVQTIVVVDNNAPRLVGLPSRNIRTVTCTPGTFPTVTATDLGCTAPTVTTSDLSTQGSDPTQADFYNYDLTRTYTATDGCNTTTGTYTFRVRDGQRPVFSFNNPPVPTDANECFATISIDLAAEFDDCADDQYLTFTNDADVRYGIGNGQDLITGTLGVGRYPISFSATDPSGNSSFGSFTLVVEDKQAPFANCSPVTAFMSNGQAVILADQVDDGSSDQCGGPVTLSLDNDTFTSTGTFPVVLTVTDDAGNASTCATTVTVVAPVNLSAASIQGGTGSVQSLPIVVENFSSVAGLSGTISLSDPSVADFQPGSLTFNPALTPAQVGSFNTIVGSDQVTFVWSGPGTVSIADGSALFNIDVVITGSNGDVSDVDFGSNPTPFEVVVNLGGVNTQMTPTTNNPAGTITVNGGGTNAPEISGSLTTPGGAPIALADVNYTGGTSGTVSTGAPGTYVYNALMNAATTVTPSKDFNYSNGVDVGDLFTVNQAILGNRALVSTGERRLAADADASGQINILDVVLLQNVVLNPTTATFPAESWRFYPAGQTFSFTASGLDVPAVDNSRTIDPVLGDQMGVDFVGLKVGDLNGTSNAQLRTGEQASLRVQDLDLVRGQQYRVPVLVGDFTDLGAYQATVSLAGAKLIAAEAGELDGMGESNFSLADDAASATHLYVNGGLTAYDAGTVAFYVELVATRDARLSEVLSLSNASIATLAYGISGDQRDLVLEFERVSSTFGVDAAGFSLSQNRPNPFNAETTFDFSVDQPQRVTLSLIDQTGRTVLSRVLDATRGKQSVRLSADELPAAGVYRYQILTESGAATRTMLLVR